MSDPQHSEASAKTGCVTFVARFNQWHDSFSEVKSHRHHTVSNGEEIAAAQFIADHIGDKKNSILNPVLAKFYENCLKKNKDFGHLLNSIATSVEEKTYTKLGFHSTNDESIATLFAVDHEHDHEHDHYLVEFLAEIAAFSPDPALELHAFIIRLRQGGLTITDAHEVDIRRLYAIKLEEKTFIAGFLQKVHDYYNDKISVARVGDYIAETIQAWNQLNIQTRSNTFYPKLQFMLALPVLIPENPLNNVYLDKPLTDEITTRFLNANTILSDNEALKKAIEAGIKENNYLFPSAFKTQSVVNPSLPVADIQADRPAKQFLLRLQRKAIAIGRLLMKALTTIFLFIPLACFSGDDNIDTQNRESEVSVQEDSKNSQQKMPVNTVGKKPAMAVASSYAGEQNVHNVSFFGTITRNTDVPATSVVTQNTVPFSMRASFFKIK